MVSPSCKHIVYNLVKLFSPFASHSSECADGGSRQQPPAWDPQYADRDRGGHWRQRAGSGPGQLPDYIGGGTDLAAVCRGCPTYSGWGVKRCGGSQRAVSHTRGRRSSVDQLKACMNRNVYAHVRATVLFMLSNSRTQIPWNIQTSNPEVDIVFSVTHQFRMTSYWGWQISSTPFFFFCPRNTPFLFREKMTSQR